MSVFDCFTPPSEAVILTSMVRSPFSFSEGLVCPSLSSGGEVGSGDGEVGSGDGEVGSGDGEVGSGDGEVGSGDGEVGSRDGEVGSEVVSSESQMPFSFVSTQHIPSVGLPERSPPGQ